MHSHFHLFLFGKSNLKCLSRRSTEIVNTSVNISWTMERRTHFTSMPAGWCHTVHVPPALLCRLAAKNSILYSSWVSQDHTKIASKLLHPSGLATTCLWFIGFLLVCQWVWLLWILSQHTVRRCLSLGSRMASAGAGLLLHYRTAMIASNTCCTQVLVS